MRLPFNTSRSPIGIDPSGRTIAAVQLTARGNRWRLEAATSVRREDPTVPLSANELREFANVLDRAGFEGRDVVLAVPPERLIADLVEVPSKADRAEAGIVVRNDLARLNQIEPESLSYEWWPLPEQGGGGRAVPAMAVACVDEHANELLDTVESCGFSVVGLDAACWSLSRACAPEFPTGVALHAILSINARTADLVVLHGETVVYQRVFAESGLNALDAALQQRLDLEADVVQLLLQEVGLGPVPEDFTGGTELIEDMWKQINTYTERLVNELQRSFAYASQEYGDEPVQQLILAGEGATINGLSARFAEALDRPVRVVSPRSLVECPGGPSDSNDSPALVTATGLAQYPRH